MTIFKIYTSDNRYEHVLASEIQVIGEPTGQVHNNGFVQLKGGRVIYFGSQDGWETLLRDLKDLNE